MWLQLLGRWALISLVPYAIYFVALVGESRRPGRRSNDIPVWRDQSKAFLPGDFGLTLAAAVGVTLSDNEPPSPWLIPSSIVGIIVACIAYYVGRRMVYRKDDYEERAWRSPTKRYHDIVMFVVFPILAFHFVVPMYLQGWSGEGVVMRLVGICGVLLWAGGLWWDQCHDEVPNPRQHPAIWHPLWKHHEE